MIIISIYKFLDTSYWIGICDRYHVTNTFQINQSDRILSETSFKQWMVGMQVGLLDDRRVSRYASRVAQR